GSQTRRPGRPTTKPDIAALVVRMANENPTWGYTRIRGGLKHLGHDVSRNTIKSDPEGPWHPARTRTPHDDPVEGVPRRTLGRTGGGGLRRRRSADGGGTQPVRRALRHQTQEPRRGERRDHQSTARALDDTGRAESDRRPRWLPAPGRIPH